MFLPTVRNVKEKYCNHIKSNILQIFTDKYKLKHQSNVFSMITVSMSILLEQNRLNRFQLNFIFKLQVYVF